MSHHIRIIVAAMLAVGSLVFVAYRLSQQPPVREASSPQPTSEVFEPFLAPQAVMAAQATGIHDDDLVVGVVVNGQPRAYPIRYFDLHEHINDQIGGDPVCATW